MRKTFYEGFDVMLLWRLTITESPIKPGKVPNLFSTPVHLEGQDTLPKATVAHHVSDSHLGRGGPSRAGTFKLGREPYLPGWLITSQAWRVYHQYNTGIKRMVLKGSCTSESPPGFVKTQCRFCPQSFWVRRSGAQDLHFLQAPSWRWCCGFGYHTLRITDSEVT